MYVENLCVQDVRRIHPSNVNFQITFKLVLRCVLGEFALIFHILKLCRLTHFLAIIISVLFIDLSCIMESFRSMEQRFGKRKMLGEEKCENKRSA